jgi:hypothetical protein
MNDSEKTVTRPDFSLRIEFSHTPEIKGGFDEEPQPEENEIRSVFAVDPAGYEIDITDVIEELDAWERMQHLAFGRPHNWASPERRIETLKTRIADLESNIEFYKKINRNLLGIAS